MLQILSHTSRAFVVNRMKIDKKQGVLLYS